SALRQMGIDADTAYGQMVGGALRYLQVQNDLQDETEKMGEIGKEAFMSILDLLYETGDIGDKLIGIFANIGKQFAKMGMDRLWKSITGEGKSLFDFPASPRGVGGFMPEMAGGGDLLPAKQMREIKEGLQGVTQSA